MKRKNKKKIDDSSERRQWTTQDMSKRRIIQSNMLHSIFIHSRGIFHIFIHIYSVYELNITYTIATKCSVHRKIERAIASVAVCLAKLIHMYYIVCVWTTESSEQTNVCEKSLVQSHQCKGHDVRSCITNTAAHRQWVFGLNGCSWRTHIRNAPVVVWPNSAIETYRCPMPSQLVDGIGIIHIAVVYVKWSVSLHVRGRWERTERVRVCCQCDSGVWTEPMGTLSPVYLCVRVPVCVCVFSTLQQSRCRVLSPTGCQHTTVELCFHSFGRAGQRLTAVFH